MPRKRKITAIEEDLKEERPIPREEVKKPKIVIKMACNIKGKRYEVGEEFKPTKDDVLLVNRLNEKGFIEPLSKEDKALLF